mmetsp:Transcript_19559/g.59194  ORF Transcript_19559/g.59194 Transcript_19559/m.59194 type:complete len:319 (-) Transcript_19559:2209-3165(-)
MRLDGIKAAKAALGGMFSSNAVGPLSNVAAVTGGIQVIFFLHSVLFLRRSEKYYDLSGAITNISGVAMAAAASGVKLWPLKEALAEINVPHAMLSMVIFWAGRLGFFLFSRIQRDGEDKRFRKLKTSIPSYAVAWFIQAIWCTIVPIHASIACLHYGNVLANTKDAGAERALGRWDPTAPELAALAGALVGLLFEAIADQQKKAFRDDPANKDHFIDTGLWATSRHPNYFGEIVYQTCAAALAWMYTADCKLYILGVPLRGMVWLSPLFTTFLLTRVSGIPLLEKMADKKWAKDEDYQRYKASTPVLIPWFPSKSKKA